MIELYLSKVTETSESEQAGKYYARVSYKQTMGCAIVIVGAHGFKHFALTRSKLVKKVKNIYIGRKNACGNVGFFVTL